MNHTPVTTEHIICFFRCGLRVVVYNILTLLLLSVLVASSRQEETPSKGLLRGERVERFVFLVQYARQVTSSSP